MTVYFIGAGPGAADLITVRGQRLLKRCPVCLYAGSIMPDDLLALCPPDARVVDTGPLTLEQIVAELADAHAAGSGRRAPALGRPVDLQRAGRTVPPSRRARRRLRGRARRAGFRRRRGRARPGTDRARGRADRHADAGRDAVDGDAGRGGPARRCRRPAPRWCCTWRPRRSTRSCPSCSPADTAPKPPVRWWHSRSWPQETVLRCTLATSPSEMHAADITRTAVIVVGDVLAAEGFTDSYLYSSGRRRGSRH